MMPPYLTDGLALVEVCAGSGGLLGEMLVEAAALRHVRERLRVSAVEAVAEAEGKARAVDCALDDRQ